LKKRISKQGESEVVCTCTPKPTLGQYKMACPDGVVSGADMTASKRQELFGQIAGNAGSMKPEIYQRQAIEDGTGVKCEKTHSRINLRTNTICTVSQPCRKDDGFDYSENFDGCQKFAKGTVFVNLKCIAGEGGAQTRSLREVYWFIEGQLRVLAAGHDYYFANILDGCKAAACMRHYKYLLGLPEFSHVRDRVYVGDLVSYFGWIKCSVME